MTRDQRIFELLAQHPAGLTTLEVSEATGWTQRDTTSALSKCAAYGDLTKTIATKRGSQISYRWALPAEAMAAIQASHPRELEDAR